MAKTNLGQENYSSFAKRYAQKIIGNSHNAFYERPATLSLLPDVKGLSVLDAGCGPGIYSAWLIEHGATLTAVDATPEFVQMTKERTNQSATVLQWDLEESLTFAPDGYFDIVLCPLVMDYIKDWLPVFQEFSRVLKQGGFFIFSCGHPASDFYRTWPDDNYFDLVLHEMEWYGFGEPYPLIKCYRRSLQAVLNPLIEADFHLDKVLEPRPAPDFPRTLATEDAYQNLIHEPCFLHLRAIK
ncbi:MAG: class I SAM-dependent DNA methyltransferase [Anaerolineaceae bacterium]